MSHDQSATSCRLETWAISHHGDNSPPSGYAEWSDDRLVDGYRRNSILLKEYGTDQRTICALLAIEECLRARGINPDEIIEELAI